MKQTKCPYKGIACADYGKCEDCTWCRVIEKYEKKLKKLTIQVDSMRIMSNSTLPEKSLGEVLNEREHRGNIVDNSYKGEEGVFEFDDVPKSEAGNKDDHLF